jgi:hypothetical protein
MFRNLLQYADEEILRLQTLSETEILFLTPDWEVWYQYLVLGENNTDIIIATCW